MIRIPTVFVVGAGGSQPYGFPLGSELRNLVIDPLRGLRTRERNVRRYLLRSYLDFFDAGQRYGDFIHALRDSGYASVDQFLEKNREFTEIGTLAIALALIPCEQPKRLLPPSAPAANHWYEVLVEMLDVGSPEYLRNRVTIVTYNYDRSLEAYLSTVIRGRLRLVQRKTLQKHLSHVPVIHLHGQLGSLDKRAYGDELTAGDIRLAAKGIKVIHAVNPQTPAFSAARKALRAASRIYFLGFGYNETNLTRLKVFNKEWFPQEREESIVKGTSLGLSANQWKRACTAMKGNMRASPRYRKRAAAFLRDCVDVE